MEEDLAVSIDPKDDNEIQPQAKPGCTVAKAAARQTFDDDSDEDSDDIEAELNKLEQSVCEDHVVGSDDEEEDQSHVAPFDRSLKKKKRSATITGQGPSQLQSRQLLDQTDEFD